MKSEKIILYADKKPMKGIKNPGPHQLYRNPIVKVEKRAIEELKPDEILVEMIYAGICGTDVHLVEKNFDTGYIRSSAPAEIPEEGRCIGHEGVGKVLKVGRGVQNISTGSYVTFESIIVCHFCDVCRKGHFNQCRNAKLLGLEKDGLFGTIVNVAAMLAHDITPIVKSDSDLQAMACVEPAGVAYVACQNCNIKGGDSVVVFGAGPIGLFSAMLSKSIFGAAVVYVVEPVEYRRKFVSPWCDQVFDVDEFFSNPPTYIDVVIEASGVMENVNRIFRSLNANGRAVFLARSGLPLKIDALDHMITNAITLMGSRGHLCGAFTDIISLYQQKRLPLNEIVTDVVDGTKALCDLLRNPQKILNTNCKVLARFN